MINQSTALIAVLISAAGASAAFEGFAPRIDLELPAGLRPTDSVLVDLNNDGNLDIAVSAFTPNSLDVIAVFFNNGDGTFAPAITTSVGDSPTSIAAADMNLDGKIDLLTANRDTSDFSLRLNNGDGTFQSEIFRATGASPQGVAASDFNLDGSPDVVVANEGSDSVTIYFGNSDGTFGAPLDITTNNQEGNFGHNPRDVAAADLNFDGAPDIVTANISSGHCTILYNIAAAPGNFFFGEFGTFIPAGNSPVHVVSDDLGNDGDPDLVFCSTDGNVITRFNELSESPVAFPQFPSFNTIPVGGRPVGAALVDFDDLETDGDSDLVIADEVNSRITVLLNNGNAVYTNVGTWATPSSPQIPAAGDLDGDGDQDIIVPNFNGTSVSIFFNTSVVVGGPLPIARIDMPGDFGGLNGCVCGPTSPVTGVADIPPGGLFGDYLLEYRPVSDPDAWTTIRQSGDPVAEPGDELGVWDLTSIPEGFYLLRLTATSASGLTASDQAVIWSSQNFNTVDIRIASGYTESSASAAVAGRDICIFGFINDDACGPNEYTAEYRPSIGGVWEDVDPGNPVYFGDRLNQEAAVWDTVGLGIPDGPYLVRVIANNGCGQIRPDFQSVIVDNTPPTAQIDAPENCMFFNPAGTLNVKGTAFDENLSGWTLDFTGGPFNSWVRIADGTSPVVTSLLGEWDIGSLPPCAYTLRLRVADQSVLNCSDNTFQTVDLVSVNVGCRADLAEPYNILDLSDITAFIESFTAGCP